MRNNAGRRFIISMIAGFLFLGLASVQGLALSTNYADVLVENLQIGGKYSMIKLLNMPLTIGSRYENPLKVKIEVMQPEAGGLKKGFDPIPDIKWVDVGPGVVELKPKGKYKTDIKLAIPDEETYLGKSYQVNIRSTELKEGSGIVIAVAVTARLLFTIAPVKAAPGAKAVSINLGFSIQPQQVLLKEVALGKKIKLVTSAGGDQVEVVNLGKKKIKIVLTSIHPSGVSLKIPKGFTACPNPDFLTFKKEEITLRGKSRKPVRMFLLIPDKPEFENQHYLFLASFRTGGIASGRRLLHVYVSTEADQKESNTAQEEKPTTGKKTKPEAGG